MECLEERLQYRIYLTLTVWPDIWGSHFGIHYPAVPPMRCFPKTLYYSPAVLHVLPQLSCDFWLLPAESLKVQYRPAVLSQDPFQRVSTVLLHNLAPARGRYCNSPAVLWPGIGTSLCSALTSFFVEAWRITQSHLAFLLQGTRMVPCEKEEHVE